MTDLTKLLNQKERILSMMRLRGPSLPIHVARGINVNSLFAGAYLSELFAERKIKISHMKVGGSPLYFLEGQEELLEKFLEYLNGRERETFFLLKDKKVLEDSEQTPITRVALRVLRDFAFPMKVKVNDQEKLFWRYHLTAEESAKGLVRERASENIEVKAPKKEAPIKLVNGVVPVQDLVEIKEEVVEQSPVLIGQSLEIKKTKKREKKSKPKEIKEAIEIKKIGEVKEVKETQKIKEKGSVFGEVIRSYLAGKNVEVLEVFLDKKKEFLARVQGDFLFGKQEFYLAAKDKKIINDNDLILVSQQAQARKMPALVISPGVLHKKAHEYLKDWGNLVRFEKIE